MRQTAGPRPAKTRRDHYPLVVRLHTLRALRRAGFYQEFAAQDFVGLLVDDDDLVFDAYLAAQHVAPEDLDLTEPFEDAQGAAA